jgi:hypothetical protein
MDSPKDDRPTQPEAEPRKVSRRAVMQAGVKAGPVLMTLPTVPAWAAMGASVNSQNFTCEDNPAVESCQQGAGTPGDGLNELDDPFASPAKGKGKDKKKDKQGQGAFLNSGNWLD